MGEQMASTSGRAEAERWLGIAEKLLSGGDLRGSRTFATRARESDPRPDRSDRILAVVDTLIAGTGRINNQRDWYAVLQLVRGTQDQWLISNNYSRLAVLLSPVTNNLPFADEAFRLVSDAFSVLSNTFKKSLYDHELSLSSQSNPESGPGSEARQPRPSASPSPGEAKGSAKAADDSIPSSAESDAPKFWTACPYCFYLYEYPSVYEEYALRCHNCQRAFHAVVVPPPPDIGSGKDSYFCSWEFFPLGFLGQKSESSLRTEGLSNWTPFSPLFACPAPVNAETLNVMAGIKSVSKSRNAKVANRRVVEVLTDEEYEDFVDLSDPSEDSDDDWGGSNRNKKKAKKASRASGCKIAKARKGDPASVAEKKKNTSEISGAGYVMQEGVGVLNFATPESGKVAAINSRRQRGKAVKDLGNLDLNVEFSNDAEDAATTVSENETQSGECSMEGIAFFEGLDEFLSNLPILSVVGDGKDKTAD